MKGGISGGKKGVLPQGRGGPGPRPVAVLGGFTTILNQVQQGNPKAAEELLPFVYDELRKLAAAKLFREQPGQTLQATALVHEAWLRLVGPDEPKAWNSRGHFFGAAAEAMRRI